MGGFWKIKLLVCKTEDGHLLVHATQSSSKVKVQVHDIHYSKVKTSKASNSEAF